jgi:predicted RNA-binding Zn-ribbon protein involved in translation (DUF1610 family)
MIKIKEERYFCKYCYRELDVEDVLIENECPYCGKIQKTIKEINKEEYKW